jgi:hypothetical protein
MLLPGQIAVMCCKVCDSPLGMRSAVPVWYVYMDGSLAMESTCSGCYQWAFGNKKGEGDWKIHGPSGVLAVVIRAEGGHDYRI